VVKLQTRESLLCASVTSQAFYYLNSTFSENVAESFTVTGCSMIH